MKVIFAFENVKHFQTFEIFTNKYVKPVWQSEKQKTEIFPRQKGSLMRPSTNLAVIQFFIFFLEILNRILTIL